MLIEQGLDPFCEFSSRWFDALSAAVKERNLLPGGWGIGGSWGIGGLWGVGTPHASWWKLVGRL